MRHSDQSVTISIEGSLVMLDDTTPHVAVPVQAMRDGEVAAMTLSDEIGKYRFVNLDPGMYEVRCQILEGYVYYGREKSVRPENGTISGESASLLGCNSASVKVERGRTLSGVDLRFAPFKKGTWKSYTYMDGLAHNWVTSIYRDADGAMWFGTWGGVSRYDGEEFVNFTVEDGLASDDIAAIYRDLKGVLWFGTGDRFRAGRGVSMYDGEEFISLTEENGLISNTIFAIHCDPEGLMWFGTLGGVSCYDGKDFINFTTDDGLADNVVFAVHHDLDGVMWFGTAQGLSRYDGREFVNFTVEDGLANNRVNAICCDPDGVLWLGTGDSFQNTGGVSLYNGEKFARFTEEDGLLGGAVLTAYCDFEGVMWFGTSAGVCRYDGSGFVNFTTKDGLINSSVLAVHRDHEGMMWFGTREGVSSYDEKRFVNFTAKDGLVSNNVTFAYRSSDGVLWVGGRGVSCYDGRDFAGLATGDVLTSSLVRDVFCSPDGDLWFATTDGVIRYDGVELTSLPLENELANENVHAIDGTPDGAIWFGTVGGGVYRYDGKELINFTTEDGLSHNQVWTVRRSRDGVMWFGTWGGGISRYDGNTFTNLTVKDGLASDNITAIYETSDGIMWFGSLHRGVSRYDGKEFVNFSTKDGLSSNAVYDIYRDPKGVMWFGTRDGGVSCYDGVTWMSLDKRDGLAGNHVSSVHQDSDGYLWFATAEGLTRYLRSDIPPKVFIASVTTDKAYADVSNIPTLTCGTRVTVEYGSIDFKTAPEKRQYRCRIREIDSDWRSPTRSRSFDYIFNKPGDYTFEVQAVDQCLSYSEPAVLQMTVRQDPVLLSLQNHISRLQREVRSKYHFESIIGRSAVMKQVNALMEKAIDSGLTVLISGETGTGKELVAKAIHYNSPRKDYPLLDLNCGAVPKELVASTLFGHRRGAFTGAHEDKAGLFESASRGTLLLDEISEMPEAVQLHLLRVLQEQKIQRIGEIRLRAVDVRVIAITNRDLESAVKAGRFREDLYYRLSVFPIHVPPLRERVEDILLLSEHFLQKACHQQNKDLKGFAPGVMNMFMSYSWPGNVRELEHEIYRSVALAEGGTYIQTYHFSTRITRGESLIQEILSEHLGYGELLNLFRRRLVSETLLESGGNRSEAARRLGMDPSNLRSLIKRLRIKA